MLGYLVEPIAIEQFVNTFSDRRNINQNVSFQELSICGILRNTKWTYDELLSD